MNKPILKYFLYALFFNFVFIGFSGCGTGPQQKTGFLSDYSKLSPSPYKDAEGAMAYMNPKNPLKNYDKFILSPVQIRLSQKGKERGIDEGKLRELAAYFDQQLRAELGKSDYSIVNQPGPETLVLKAALTDINPAAPLANIHPAMIATGVGLGGASMEVEIQDALTGEVAAAVIDTQKGGRGFDGLTKYGNAKDVIEKWCKRLVIRMDEAHGKTRK
jgi:hypothetical protein